MQEVAGSIKGLVEQMAKNIEIPNKIQQDKPR
jgi:hypothetical protein